MVRFGFMIPALSKSLSAQTSLKRTLGHRPGVLRAQSGGAGHLAARPDDATLTGAVIKSCCRLMSFLAATLVQAAQDVVPMAITAGDKIEGLRQWASGRCLRSDRPGMCSRSEAGGGRVRRLVRGPGLH